MKGQGVGTTIRRILLVLAVLVLPALLTWLTYQITEYALYVTQRVIDPFYTEGAAVIEFAVFTFIAFLEARERWSLSPSPE